MKMRAILVPKTGEPEVLQFAEIDEPQPQDYEVLIRVQFVGVNKLDTSLRRGNYTFSGDATPFLGFECSGTIESVGKNVTMWNIGDKVCALLDGGGYAEKVTVPEGQVLPIPTGVSMIEAATLPFAACTVWSTVFITSRLYPGETFLIRGGSGGIDAFAIQAAKYCGCRVIVAADDYMKLAFCLSIGADVCINYNIDNFVARVKKETDGRGADVILDCIGLPFFQRNLDCLNLYGRLYVIVSRGDAMSATIDLGVLFSKHLTVQGGYLSNRSYSDKSKIINGVKENLWPAIEDGKIRPFVQGYFPLSEAAKAHWLMETGQQIGKILLRP